MMAGAPTWLVAVVLVVLLAGSVTARAIAAFPRWSRQARPEIERWADFLDRRRSSRDDA